MSKKKTTINIDSNDSLIQLRIKDMKPGNMMFASPESLYILNNGGCWLDAESFVGPQPKFEIDRVMGVLKDLDDKFIVFARNLGFAWDKSLSHPNKYRIPIKELKNIAQEILDADAFVTKTKDILIETFDKSFDEDFDEDDDGDDDGDGWKIVL